MSTTNITLKQSFQADVEPETKVFISGDCVIQTKEYNADGVSIHTTVSLSRNNQFINILSGNAQKDVLDMLTTAVNNRTRERNYFKLYCDLLDGTISDEEFDKEISVNEDKYIVASSINPSPDKARVALNLSKRIKDVNTISDFCSLFSFNENHIESLMLE